MQYQISIDGITYISGNLIIVAIVALVLVILAIIAFIIIRKRLIENNHMKYEFVTIVAHKFRTPMTYIKWVCDTLIPDETDSFKKKSLEDIKKSNQKIIDLVSTLIEIADDENKAGASYVIDKFPIYDFTKSVADRFKDTLHEKNLFFSLDCDDKTAMVKADQSRLEFVLTTLLDNAQTYTNPGQNVAVFINASLLSVKISVQDSGIGISKSDLPHIFSKFYRGKNARSTDTEGFGVGLYLANSIIKKLGGKMSVESPGEGMGSIFSITLPRVR